MPNETNNFSSLAALVAATPGTAAVIGRRVAGVWTLVRR